MKNWKNLLGEIETYYDFVQCEKCKFMGGVNIGVETCPSCHAEGNLFLMDEASFTMTAFEIDQYLDKNHLTKERLFYRLEEEGCNESGLSEMNVDYIASYVTDYSHAQSTRRTLEAGNIYVKTLDGIVQLPFFEINTGDGYEQLDLDFATIVSQEHLEGVLKEESRRVKLHEDILNTWSTNKKPAAEKKDKYVVCIAEEYTRDIQFLYAPSGLSDDEFEIFKEAFYDQGGERLELNKDTYGWSDAAYQKVFLGVVEASTQDEAKEQFRFPKQILLANKI